MSFFACICQQFFLASRLKFISITFEYQGKQQMVIFSQRSLHDNMNSIFWCEAAYTVTLSARSTYIIMPACMSDILISFFFEAPLRFWEQLFNIWLQSLHNFKTRESISIADSFPWNMVPHRHFFYYPSRPSVGWSVGWLVGRLIGPSSVDRSDCHNFLK